MGQSYCNIARTKLSSSPPLIPLTFPSHLLTDEKGTMCPENPVSSALLLSWHCHSLEIFTHLYSVLRYCLALSHLITGFKPVFLIAVNVMRKEEEKKKKERRSHTKK